jgi:hypothetical protein
VRNGAAPGDRVQASVYRKWFGDALGKRRAVVAGFGVLCCEDEEDRAEGLEDDARPGACLHVAPEAPPPLDFGGEVHRAWALHVKQGAVVGRVVGQARNEVEEGTVVVSASQALGALEEAAQGIALVRIGD